MVASPQLLANRTFCTLDYWLYQRHASKDDVEVVKIDAMKIGYLGPEGTFTQEALRTQSDLNGLDLIPYSSIAILLEAVQDDQIEMGFVPIENSIEGTVAVTIDSLIFDCDLVIVREVVHNIHLQLLGISGAVMDDIAEIWSYSHALAQCRRFLAHNVGAANIKESLSTADGAYRVASSRDIRIAAIAPRIAGEIYQLVELATNIEDHDENQTRFYLVRKGPIPKPTGHDKTSIACFQLADAPGSLFSILAEFSARNINLTKLESRPSKLGLGQYCFVIEFDGHIAEPIVGDLFLSLRRKLADIKFLGSFPNAKITEQDVNNTTKLTPDEASRWVEDIRRRIE